MMSIFQRIVLYAALSYFWIILAIAAIGEFAGAVTWVEPLSAEAGRALCDLMGWVLFTTWCLSKRHKSRLPSFALLCYLLSAVFFNVIPPMQGSIGRVYGFVASLIPLTCFVLGWLSRCALDKLPDRFFSQDK